MIVKLGMTIFRIHNCWLLETTLQPIQRSKISLEFDLPTTKTTYFWGTFLPFLLLHVFTGSFTGMPRKPIRHWYGYTRTTHIPGQPGYDTLLGRGWKSSGTCRSRSDPPASGSTTAFLCLPLRVLLPTILDVNRDKFRDSSDWSDCVAQILQNLLTIPENSSSKISASVFAESHHVAVLFFFFFYFFKDDFWSSRAFVGCLSASGFAGAWDWSYSKHGKWKCGSRHAKWAAAANAVGWGSGGHQ